MAFPHELPKHLHSAFVRGFFDGDGSIYYRDRRGWRATQCKFVSGSRDMLVGLGTVLTDAGIAVGRMCRGSGRALVLPVLTRQTNLRRFSQYLYAGATVWLWRKRAVFEELGMP